MYEGFTQLGSKEGIKNLGGKLGYAGVAGLAAPLLSSAMEPGKFNPPAKTPTQYYKFDYRPPKYNRKLGITTQRLMVPVLTIRILPNMLLRAVRLDMIKAG
jgi:hypothetical protein